MHKQVKFIVSLIATCSFQLSWIFLGVSNCDAQDKGQIVPPLTFELVSPEQPCVGKSFTLQARLKNISKRKVMIDTGGFWRYVTEKALDQSSSSLFGVPLTIPKMRGTVGDIGHDEASQFVVLKPGQSHTVALTVNPSKDDFYRSPGRYSVTSIYGASTNRTANHPDLFIGTIAAPELHFKIVECKMNGHTFTKRAG